MSENSAKEAAPLESKEKRKRKQKDAKPKAKKTRRHFREEAQRARAEEAKEVQEVKPDTDRGEPKRTDSMTSLSPSAVVEMFHLQDEESVSSTAAGTTARFLVENETSGDFYQVRSRKRRQLDAFPAHRHSSLHKAQQKLRDGSEHWLCWSILRQDGEKAAVVMILGVVAGMCWMDALNLHSSSGADSFLCAYSAGANRSRQNFFILFNVLIGLMRKLRQMDPHQEYKALGDGAAAELTSYRLIQAATALMSAALLVLLIDSPSALRLSRSQETIVNWCVDVAPTSILFQREVLTLQVCAVLNTALVTAAWLLVALQCSVTMSSTATTRCRVAELQDAVTEQEKRIHELRGSHLEGLSAEDLKSLIQLHQRAIDLTEGVLVSKLQALHRPTAAG